MVNGAIFELFTVPEAAICSIQYRQINESE
jgi:hypothetical protein